MIKLQLIEKKVDSESGKYPVPVLYKAQPELLTYIKSSMMREEFSDNLEAMLKESKDPLMILDMIHDVSQLNFIKILGQIQEDKSMTWEELIFLEELFLWENYRHFTLNLIAATGKIIDEIDIDKLLVSQAKRRKEILEMLIKRYEELGIAKK